MRDEILSFEGELSKKFKIQHRLRKKLKKQMRFTAKIKSLVAKLKEFRTLPEPKINGSDLLKINIANGSVRKGLCK